MGRAAQRPTVNIVQDSDAGLGLRRLGLEVIRRRGTNVERFGYTLVRLRRPGRCLTANERELLFSMLINVSTQIFGVDTEPYWRAREGFFDFIDELWTLDSAEGFQGWCAGSVLTDSAGHSYVYLDTLNFLPLAQRQGIGTSVAFALWLSLVKRERRLMPLCCRTQAPGVYRLLHALSARHTYPQLGPTARKSPQRVIWVARDIACRMNPGAEFDPVRFVVRGSGVQQRYGRPLDDRPGDDAIEHHFSENVVIARGDALIVMIYPRLLGYLRFLVGSVVLGLLVRLRPGIRPHELLGIRRRRKRARLPTSAGGG